MTSVEDSNANENRRAGTGDDTPADLAKYRKAKRQIGHIEAAAQLRDESPLDRAAVGYSARVWAQLSLPYKHPVMRLDDGSKTVPPFWRRENGNVTLTLQPAVFSEQPGAAPQLGYPYGVLPRFLMTWMTTEAVMTQDPTLHLGRTLSEFLQKLGLSSRGGKRGDITRLRSQMRRLFGSRLTIEEETSNDQITRLRGQQLSIAAKWDLFFPKNQDEAPLWESSITLSDEFFTSVVESPVPIDLDAVRLLSRSPMQMDIYIWLASRLWRVEKPVNVTWQQLSIQFGSETARLRRFKETFLENLRYVQQVYPGADVRISDNGLRLMPSPPPIAKLPELH